MFGFGKKTSDSRQRVEPTVSNSVDYVDVASSDIVKMGQIFGNIPTAAGAIVNAKTAMRVSAVYACVRLIAGAVSTLPCSFYKRTADGRERANDHAYWWYFNEQPTPRFTAAAFWEFMVSQMLLRGDGIAYIVRPSKMAPGIAGIIPVSREKVTIFRQDDRLRYTITDSIDGATGKVGSFTIDQDDVLHLPGCAFDGIHSMSVIGWAERQAIGIALKADEHAATTFGSGASIQYAVKAPKAMTPQMQDNFREAWVAKYSGMGVAQTPLILTEGLEVQELSMTAADAQLLESRKFQVVDIARAFGVPPHMIGETSASTSWGTGIEQMSIGFVTYTLLPHLIRFQQELNRKLFPVRDRYFVEFNVDGLLAGDSTAQAEYFGKALGGPGAKGWMSQNEVRRLKNLPTKADPSADDISSGTPPANPTNPAPAAEGTPA
jgi:HK97 family phage portal protein